jgi:Lhr-like helicase
MATPSPLAWAHPITAEWFLTRFGSPTEPQEEGWPSIVSGAATLISAPTGSGKTFAAFLVAIDTLLRHAIAGTLEPHTHVVYISPLKALSNDIQKNLDTPLREIQQLALTRGYLCPEIRTGVRTGDTPTKDRAAMLRHPPHILVTTPESLYLLLTAGKSREHLRRVRTVIVDEIHAVADDKRGAHLALSLERLDALVTGENRLCPGAYLTGLATPPQRIGISATQNPIELVAQFLTGCDPERKPANIIQVGQRRVLDIAIEVPSDELGSITTNGMWSEIFDKLAAHANSHRSTLVFVNTRRLVEKIAFALSERLGEEHVAAHHGSLSRELRLDAEQRLKSGEIKILVATASLELGIDIGDIDLVCQIASTRAVAVAMQRVGRAGHWRGAVPKGRLFATTRDDLLEQAALVKKMRAGELDRLEVPDQPIDVLMQQIVACCGAESWEEEALFNVLRRAYPYRNLTRSLFDELIVLLNTGIESSRGRYGAYLLRDGVQQQLHPRRGARMIAIANGGSIPDNALYNVILQPEGLQIATLDEHFAVDSRQGDVILLGNTSWRVQRVEAAGRVLVEDAHGAPPNVPFWFGEAPQRTAVLSDGVSDLRECISSLTPNLVPTGTPQKSALSTEASSKAVISTGASSKAVVSTEASSKAALSTEASSKAVLSTEASSKAFISTGASSKAVLSTEASSKAILSTGASSKAVISTEAKRSGETPAFRPPTTATHSDSETWPGAPPMRGPIANGWDHGTHPELLSATSYLTEHCGVCTSGAHQLIAYIVAGRAVLGAVPSKTTIIAERFFDDGGGMQLILHAPFGGRINKAWGLALRKRFCRGFNFELQAAATDNGINISLAEQHSFPLSDVFHFLTEHTAKELLEQAAIASPIFKARWRWAAGRSLQLLRMSNGKRIAPQIQRTRSEDLLASVFPQAAACFETIVGDIQIPAHPLVDEVMKDVLQEAMDLEGLIEVLIGIKNGTIRCLAVDTPVPSQFAHELLNANPYAYLDEAGTEERRARAVSLGRGVPASVLDAYGKEATGNLDPAAIATVRREIFPDLRDEHELHDLLQSLVALPLRFLDQEPTRHWPIFYERLIHSSRASTIDCVEVPCWAATERLPHLATLYPPTPTAVILSAAKDPDAAHITDTARPSPPANPHHSPLSAQIATTTVTKEIALKQIVQGWLQILGPTTAASFATLLSLDPADVFKAFLAMEMQGLLLRGVFEHLPTTEDHAIEWCERRILQRIHRLTLGTRRKQVEAVTPAVFMRWLLRWQHLAPQSQLIGEEGVLEALRQLEGFEAPAVEWERTLLPARVANYDPRHLDNLCLSGAVGWGRISPHPAWRSASSTEAPRRVIPTNAAPITFYVRESADWLPHALAENSVDESRLAAALSPEALQVRTLLQQRGACFANDLQRITALTRPQTQHALWELATAGLAAADGFDQLRAMMDPRRKSIASPSEKKTRSSQFRSTAGRWSLLCEEAPSTPTPAERARQTDRALESAAEMLLARYGVLFRDLLVRESNAPKWRDLLNILRRLEARGEVRGGRFVTGFGGEQFALPEAVESLRLSRNAQSDEAITVPAADPMNLSGIVVPGERVPSVPGKSVVFDNGQILTDEFANAGLTTADLKTPTRPARLPRYQQPPTPLPVTGPPTLRLF